MIKNNETTYSNVGNLNLETIDGANNFTEWMYEQVKPYLKGTILEIGSGAATYSKKIIRDFPNNTIILSEIDQEYIHQLELKFKGVNKVNIQNINLENQENFKKLGMSYDSVFALNVLEHVQDDETALKNIYNYLSPGGTCVLLVPAHNFLFNNIDSAIGHFRRYSKKELMDKATNAGFVINRTYYFNFFSIAGWYINGSLLKKSVVDNKLVSIFDKMVPLFKKIEKYILWNTMGISLIIVLSKKN